jgi:hypothetical protein
MVGSSIQSIDVTSNIIKVSTILYSTMRGSTLIGSSIQANAVNSNVIEGQTIGYSTLRGSALYSNTIYVNTLSTNALGAQNINVSNTITVSSISSLKITTSSLSGNIALISTVLVSTNVGIGANNPADVLHLRTLSTTGNIGIVTQNGTRQWRAGVRGDTTSNYTIQDDTAGAMRFAINSVGNVGIGTVAPFSIFHSYGIGVNQYNGIITLENTNTSRTVPITWSCGPNNNGTFIIGKIGYVGNTTILSDQAPTGVQITPGNSSWGAISDRRMKRNINTIDSSLSSIMQLRPVTFNYNTDEADEVPRPGFIAQEMDVVYPNATNWIVTDTKTMYTDNDGNEYSALSVSTTELIPYLVKSIQELAARVSTLEAR